MINCIKDYSVQGSVHYVRDDKTSISLHRQDGFTLVELLIVMVIVASIAAFAYPSYQRNVIKTKRTDAMSEMHNIGNSIQAQKLQKGGYDSLVLNTGNYPSNNPIYNITVPSLSADWVIRAEPIEGTASDGDGTLTLNSQGVKCRVISNTEKKCGLNDEWNR